MEGNNIGVYKAYIKDINSLKDLTFSLLFGESNGPNLRPNFSFLSILIIIEEFLIVYIYLFINYIYIQPRRPAGES